MSPYGDITPPLFIIIMVPTLNTFIAFVWFSIHYSNATHPYVMYALHYIHTIHKFSEYKELQNFDLYFFFQQISRTFFYVFL